jgi:hypothetical protein
MNYDTYDSAIVAADSEEEARNMPVGDKYSWCEPKDVQVEYIGEAKDGTEKGIILSSFNAG